MQEDQAQLGNAVEVSTGAERNSKARITRWDGSTVIGHMEVGVDAQKPPSCGVWGPVKCRCIDSNLLYKQSGPAAAAAMSGK